MTCRDMRARFHAASEHEDAYEYGSQARATCWTLARHLLDTS